VAKETRDTVDFEFKHHWDPDSRHDVVWGLNYRWTRDDIDGTWNTSFDPDSRSDNLWSAFIQDDVRLVTDRLWLTLGSKFEHNDYSGWEIQPNARLRFKPSANQMLWAAVSRAVRTPSRSDHDLCVNLASVTDPLGNVSVLRIQGNDDFEAEELIAYEAGYRWQPDPRFYLDLAAFYNDYERLRDIQNGSPYMETAPAPPHLVIPQRITNDMEGHTYGVEALATWKPADIWQLSASYAWIELDLHRVGPNANVSVPSEEGTSPTHQFHMRSYLDLPWQLHLDTEFYYVDRLKALNLDGYARVDLRLEWHPTPRWTFGMGIENLLDDAHIEFDDRAGLNASEMPRTVYGQVTLRF
jgi:iron complex outermembrane receptor protein